jgi:D-aminopeptidase
MIIPCIALAMATDSAAEAERPRAREVGVAPGIMRPGPLNAITDVKGVRVGHFTLVEGENVRTGATAILPHSGNIFAEKTPAAISVANGFGKLMGITQVRELGEIETPIVLTNTLAVPRAAEAILTWTLGWRGNEGVRSVNAVVGETNDGRLNDIRARPLTEEMILRAIRDASDEQVAEGAVGAGTGTVAFGWKGGIGTSSRIVDSYTVGVLVQSNYGGSLEILGVPMFGPADRPPPFEASEDGSIMIVIATDAPLSPRNLERLAFRSFLAVGRTGSWITNGSGDYAIAFSTTGGGPLPNEQMSNLFRGVVEATEEAIYNSLFKASAMRGHGDLPSRLCPFKQFSSGSNKRVESLNRRL